MAITSNAQTVTRIPVVDFSKEDCLKPGTSYWLSTRKDVCHALEELGCFMAVLPSKVQLELCNTIFGTLNELFDFPIEIKAETPQERPIVDGHVNRNSLHESLAVGRNTEKTRKFTQHFWPNGNDQFRESIDLYAKVMEELDQVVTRMVFENYGTEKYHDDYIQSTVSNLRFTKYNEPEKTGKAVGLSSHTDKTFTTILHQNHVNGLEINTKDNEWIGFDPLPSSCLFLAGDGFQVWINGRIRSCKHRVTLRENEVRYSTGLFSYQERVIQIPNELIDKDHPIRYKPLHLLEYVQYYRANHSTVGLDNSVKDYCGVGFLFLGALVAMYFLF